MGDVLLPGDPAALLDAPSGRLKRRGDNTATLTIDSQGGLVAQDAAEGILGALENEVQAQSGKSIPSGTADGILATADLLIGLLLPAP